MNKHVEENSEQNPHMGEVVKGVWVGSLSSLSHLDPSKEWTVITILSSQRLIKLASHMISGARVKHHVIWRLDDDPKADLLSEDHFGKILFLLDHSEACLIHCAKGVSRSVAVCAAWMLVKRKCTTVEQAVQTIRQVRPEANPNLGFLACLRALEQCCGDIPNARKRLAL